MKKCQAIEIQWMVSKKLEDEYESKELYSTKADADNIGGKNIRNPPIFNKEELDNNFKFKISHT